MNEMKRVLIIEDDPFIRELEKALFEIKGYTVFEAGDAKSGLRIAKDENPDVIVIDFQLPKMNGIKAIQLFKNDPDTKNIPCVIVTASATEEQKELLKSSDACGYITKPINTRTFVEEVIKLSREHRSNV